MAAYLAITLNVPLANRDAVAAACNKHRGEFLGGRVSGALSKQLLVRPEDVLVLHGFVTAVEAQAYLASNLSKDVMRELRPFLGGDPDIRIYEAAA